MNSLDTEFHRLVQKRLDEEKGSAIDDLASGLLDHLDYKRVCGRIKALKDVSEWCQEIEANMNEGR